MVPGLAERRHGGQLGKKRLRASLQRQWESVDARLERWLEAEDPDEEDNDGDGEGEGEEATAKGDEWPGRLIRPGVSLALYQLYLSFDGQHLPWPGGLLDQPDWWIHDVNLLAERKAKLRKGRERQKAPVRRVQRRKRMLEERRRGRR